MPTLTCETCLQEFTKKDRYDSHLARKNPCKPPKAVKEIIQEKVQEEVRKNNNTEIDLSGDKEKQQSFFEDLHNLLWNKAGLSPEKALEHMTFFFAYRLIEIQADSLKLPQECRWSYIANMNNENDMFETMKKGCVSFQRIEITKPFFKKPEIQKADVVYDIIKLINRIPIKNLQETDTLGDIFEYMLSRGMSTMADEGQYFTNRKICSLAFKLAYDIKQTVFREDGSLCTFADWFCGTGGFPAEYVKGVKNIHKDIDWKVHSNSIYCQDMNISSVTTTLLNMLILTGVPFNDKKIRSGNSFSDPITIGKGSPFENIQIDYCFMNPPYGGDKTKGKEYKFAYAKGKGVDKKYLVNKEIQSIGIEDDDKVSAGVQLAMATLAPGGICAIVLPQGFFFGASKKCIELRKKLAEEYKISYVVDIASGSFINTGTKTSMLIFQKGVGPTDKVSFIGLDETVLVEATLEELIAKNYSLNYKQYLQQNIVEVEGFEMVKLGDIASVNTGKNKTLDDKKGKLYPYYGTSGITGYTDHFLEDGEYILTARNGTIGNTFLINGKSYPSDHMFSIRTNEKCLIKYLYYWMMSNKQKIEILANTTTIPGITKSALVDIQIPLPSLEIQQQIVEAIDGWTQLAHQEEHNLKLLEKQVMFEVKEMGKGTPRVKLADVCEFKRGKSLTKKEFIEGDFPVVGGGTKPVGYHNAYNVDENTILVSQSGTAGHISRYTSKVWASDCFAILPNEKILNDWLYYVVLNLKENIEFLKEGTAQPHVYPSTIENLEVRIPSIETQKCLEKDFIEVHHKHEKISYYNSKALDAIKRLIPGA